LEVLAEAGAANAVSLGVLDLPLWRNVHRSIVFVPKDGQALILLLLLERMLLLMLP